MNSLKMKTEVQKAKFSLTTARFSRALPIAENSLSDCAREKFKLLRWDSVGRNGRSGRYKRLFYFGKWSKGSSRRAYRSTTGTRNFHSRFGLLISNADPSRWSVLHANKHHGSGIWHYRHHHHDQYNAHFQWFFLKNQGGLSPYAICTLSYRSAKINLREIKPFNKSQNRSGYSSSFVIPQFNRTKTSRANYQYPAYFSSTTSKVVDISTIIIKQTEPKTNNPDSKQVRKKKPNTPGHFWPIPKKNGGTHEYPPEYLPAAKSAISANAISIGLTFSQNNRDAQKLGITCSARGVCDSQLNAQNKVQKPMTVIRIQETKFGNRFASSKYGKLETHARTPNPKHVTLDTGNRTLQTGNPTTRTENQVPNTHIGYIPSTLKKIIHQKLASEAAVPE